MSDTPIFNMTQLLNYTAEDRNLAGEVVQVFLSDIPHQLSSLQTALDSGDVKTAERVAHSVKGASATVGAETMYKMAFKCEQLGREHNLDAVRPMVPELTRQFDLLRNEMAKAGFIQA